MSLEKEFSIQVTLSGDGMQAYMFVIEYDFNRSFDNTPQIREDGTVDYWSMNLIETVITGQVIAIYKPAVQGQGGYTVRGVF